MEKAYSKGAIGEEPGEGSRNTNSTLLLLQETANYHKIQPGLQEHWTGLMGIGRRGEPFSGTKIILLLPVALSN